VEIYDEYGNVRCQARRRLWFFGRDANGKWDLCFNGHPVVHFRVLPGGKLEFQVDHWWSLLVTHFPRRETLICRGAVRRVRPAQLRITWANSRGALSIYLIGQPLALLRSGHSPIQFEREGFGLS
jgi:hypothetical protein